MPQWQQPKLLALCQRDGDRTSAQAQNAHEGKGCVRRFHVELAYEYKSAFMIGGFGWNMPSIRGLGDGGGLQNTLQN